MPYLRLYAGGNLQDQWEVGANRLDIGRAADNDIVLQDPQVSKHHAHIETDGRDYVLVDDQSANGVFVKNQRVGRHTLAYWDEIQICSHKLVFMSSARLPGEAAGHDIQEQPELEQSGTVFLKAGDLSSLRKAFEKPPVAHLTVVDSGVRLLLEKVNFTLGRARDNDLRCGGWFAPRLAATIQRRQDGHDLIPDKRGKVFVDGEPVRDATRLVDNSDLTIQGLALKYYFRAIEGR